MAAAFAAVVGFAGQAMAAEPLVDAAWAAANVGKAGVVFLDTRGQVDYLRGHIPGAVHTNYAKDGWRVKKGDVVGMLPDDTSKLAKLIGSLGIDNATHVVLVSPGKTSTDMGISTRLFWTFKVLGDDNVSILNGGMAAYLAKVDEKGKPVNPLEKGAAKPTAKTFKVALRKDMLPDRNAVKAAMDKGGVTLVDNRPSDQYLGVTRPPVDTASGTIPTCAQRAAGMADQERRRHLPHQGRARKALCRGRRADHGQADQLLQHRPLGLGRLVCVVAGARQQAGRDV